MPRKPIPVDLIGHALTRHLDPSALKPGEYILNGLAHVEVRCAISKGKPGEAAERLTLPWAAVLAKILRRAGVKPQNAAAWLSRALNEKEISPDQDPFLAAIAAYLVELKAGQPKEPKEGKTEVSGLVEVVGWKE